MRGLRRLTRSRCVRGAGLGFLVASILATLSQSADFHQTWNIAQLQTIETVRNWRGVGQQQQQFHVGLTAAHWSRIPGVSEPTVPPVRQSVDIRGHQIAEPSGGRRQLLALPHGCLLHVQKSRLSADISISAWRNNRPKKFFIMRRRLLKPTSRCNRFILISLAD
jgi:hypothetical protein